MWPTPESRKRAPAGRRRAWRPTGGRARPRRSSPARPRVAARVEDVGAHRPVGAVVAAGRSSRGPARAPSAGIRSGWRRRSQHRLAGAQARGQETSGRTGAPGGGRGARPSGRRQSPAGESAVTEAAQPARPISSPTQPPRLLPATWGRSTPSSSQRALIAAARLAALGSIPCGSGGAAPKPGMSSTITSRSASSRSMTGSQTARAAEAVERAAARAPRVTATPAWRRAPARRRSGARGSPPPRSSGRRSRGGGSARRSRARAAAPRRRGSARARRRG